MNFIPLSKKFYEPSAEVVAPLLLGHWLLRKTPQGFVGGPIVETEAYLVNDPACHASAGQTVRNRAMWGEHGHSYVYLIYGYHFCFNAVCRPAGMAEAVLIRAIEPLFGETLMRAQRPVAELRHLTNGPAKLCAAIEITRAVDGVNLCDKKSPLIIAKNPELKSFLNVRGPLITTQRIGISKATDLALRFYLDRSPFISRRVSSAKIR